MYKIIKKKNCVFEYFQLGERTEKIILFTGFKSSINRWNKNFIENLSKYFTVICFNYPNIGHSMGVICCSILSFFTQLPYAKSSYF